MSGGSDESVVRRWILQSWCHALDPCRTPRRRSVPHPRTRRRDPTCTASATGYPELPLFDTVVQEVHKSINCQGKNEIACMLLWLDWITNMYCGIARGQGEHKCTESWNWLEEHTEEHLDYERGGARPCGVSQPIYDETYILDETCGLIEFDHRDTGLPIFSTCGPSVSFRSVKEIQDYSTFQEKFSYAVVGSASYFGEESWCCRFVYVSLINFVSSSSCVTSSVAGLSPDVSGNGHRTDTHAHTDSC